jgi:hypothetical protein
MNLCQYKNISGESGKGVHSYRLFGVAIVDVLATIVGAAILAWAAKWPFWYVLGGLFLLGIILHHIFCVETTVDRLLFSH